MIVTRDAYDEQAKLWNGPAGHAWVGTQELIDHIFAPLQALLIEAIPNESGLRILDVGCGTGGTTMAAARKAGANGHCTGVDISEPMLAAACQRAERERTRATFIYADAQTHAFEPERFDMIISRNGVMFFDEPVLAFANLRRAAKPGAPLRFITWRSAAENPFMTTAERAAAPLLPNLPVRKPGMPGQFALAEQQRIQSILDESGWRDIDVQPIDLTCTFPEAALERYFTLLGPVGLALSDADEQTRTLVIDAVRAAFDRFMHGDEIRFTAACWLVTARA
ncbi:MAG: SAM-dependent methyltransferase [Proteobacteria bacterium SG_bin9]|nr:MAG: SAM-dependent methyltransferase [Proteobacteria bacterium SG_bin9]